jgi:hypothetical protein
MARFDGPIYPRLAAKTLGIRGLKVQNGQCELQWKKVTSEVLFSTGARTGHLIIILFHKKDDENCFWCSHEKEGV